MSKKTCIPYLWCTVSSSKSNKHVCTPKATLVEFHHGENETGGNELSHSGADEKDMYVNGEVSLPANQQVITKAPPPKKEKPVRARSGDDISIHPARRTAPSEGSEFGCAASETRVKGTVGGIMQSQKHLKGQVVWRAEEKGQLPSVLEGRPARTRVHEELEPRGRWPPTFPPVDQTFRWRDVRSDS